MNGRWRQTLWTLASLSLLAACSHLPKVDRELAHGVAKLARDTTLTCARADHCATPSPLRERAARVVAESTGQAPRHLTVLLDRGPDALLARVHLIRSARHSIDLQTFIFEQDDAGGLVLDELIAAARRGVRVRVLLDQLYGLPDPKLQAALAGFHRNFELRIYNPTFGEARTQSLQFAAGVLCCFKRFNQRMHSKLLLVDDEVAITGGRNIQDRYFDWNNGYNYRDRDVLLAGPAVAGMAHNFLTFWSHRRTLPAAHLGDVAERLLLHGGPAPAALPAHDRVRAPRVETLATVAADGAATYAALAPMMIEVGKVEFFGDRPHKHDAPDPASAGASKALRELIGGVRNELVLQTPYLALSRSAKHLFRELQQRAQPAAIWVSTNSLAATDAFPVYAMSHKFKRLYLHELGFRIHEFKPYPADAPINVAATGALGPQRARLPMFGSGSTGSASGPVPLKRAGVRVGLHAKSLVIDDRVAVIGSHNFDPRSDGLNTESLVVVHDAEFAAALEASIRRDMRDENAWVIAKRPKLRLLSGLNYSLGKLSEKLPVFDLWPFSYATSYELKPGCNPVAVDDPRFAVCYRAVGAFPEVDLPRKSIYTRIITAFGAGLMPIL